MLKEKIKMLKWKEEKHQKESRAPRVHSCEILPALEFEAYQSLYLLG